MKQTLLLLFILITGTRIAGYGQTCSGSLSTTNAAPCIGQPFAIYTPSFVSYGSSITWEVSTNDQGPWTSLGSTTFNVNNGSARITVTPSESGVHYYRGIREGNCTYAPIAVTVGTGVAPATPSITANSYCSATNIILTASGTEEGTYTWYRLNSVSQLEQIQSGPSNQYVITEMPDGTFFESEFRYYVFFSNGVCTSNESTIMTVLPSGAVPPSPTITAESASICVNKSTTLTASGAGTIKWYGASPTTLLGEGSSIVINPTSTRNYFATSTINGTCVSGNSNSVNVAITSPTAVSNVPVDVNFSAANARVITDNDCKILAQFAASDPEPEIYSKTINAQVSIDNAVGVYENRPYVQRHFDFHPTEALSTGYFPYYTITMYFTQAEFDAFNTNSSVKLPLNQADAEGYASNLRILHAFGTPNAMPATPGNYSAGQVGEDCVACTTVNWSTQYNAWAVTLNTRGFSGFFITAAGATSLPVTLIDFKAERQEHSIVLNWQTAEEINSEQFEIQHSTDGKQWREIAKINAAGDSKTLQRYTYTHTNPAPRENLYRMKMVDLDATFAMSRIVSVNMNGVSSLNVFPNPATHSISARSEETIIGYRLVAPDGKTVRQNKHIHTNLLELSDLAFPGGLYVLTLNFKNGNIENRKLVIE